MRLRRTTLLDVISYNIMQYNSHKAWFYLELGGGVHGLVQSLDEQPQLTFCLAL